jgi:hypothetical protein
MKKATAVAHYGSQTKVAEKLGLTRQAIGKWGDVIPFHTAMRLASISGGKLDIAIADYAAKRRKA